MRSISVFSLLLFITLSVACDDDDNSSPTPTTSPDIWFTDSTNSGGCLNFQFYYYSDTREYGLLLSGNGDSLGLTTDWQSFALNQDDRRLTLTLYEFGQPVDAFFCDDVVEAQENPVQEWNAEEGSVRLRIAQPSDNEPGTYAIDVLMLDVAVGGIRLDRIERNNVEVGWFPG